MICLSSLLCIPASLTTWLTVSLKFALSLFSFWSGVELSLPEFFIAELTSIVDQFALVFSLNGSGCSRVDTLVGAYV